MPPVLNIALAELPTRAPQKLFAKHAGLRMNECRRVLQLVAEAERATRLVIAATRPHAARERLIDEPSVRKRVEWCIRCRDLDRPERSLPVTRDLLQRTPRTGRTPKPMQQGGCIDIARAFPACRTQPENNLCLLYTSPSPRDS